MLHRCLCFSLLFFAILCSATSSAWAQVDPLGTRDTTSGISPNVSLALIDAPVDLMAVAPPSLPFVASGTVKVNGANVPNNTVVTAYCNGVLVADAMTQMSGGNSVYAIAVNQDDPATTSKEGCAANETIRLLINANSADQTASWLSAGMLSLDLTGTQAEPSEGTSEEVEEKDEAAAPRFQIYLPSLSR